VEEARRRIAMILDPPTPEVGATYQGRVVNIAKFGAFVSIMPGRDGLLHISKMRRSTAASASARWRTSSTGPGHRGQGRRHRPAGQGLALIVGDFPESEEGDARPPRRDAERGDRGDRGDRGGRDRDGRS